jgi:hypothetical protein
LRLKYLKEVNEIKQKMLFPDEHFKVAEVSTEASMMIEDYNKKMRF